MVIKQFVRFGIFKVVFESSVISYGNQIILFFHFFIYWFESSVISYGNQTIIWMDLSE